MRKRKKAHYKFVKCWRRWWRWRRFGEMFFPTIVIGPEDL